MRPAFFSRGFSNTAAWEKNRRCRRDKKINKIKITRPRTDGGAGKKPFFNAFQQRRVSILETFDLKRKAAYGGGATPGGSGLTPPQGRR